MKFADFFKRNKTREQEPEKPYLNTENRKNYLWVDKNGLREATIYDVGGDIGQKDDIAKLVVQKGQQNVLTYEGHAFGNGEGAQPEKDTYQDVAQEYSQNKHLSAQKNLLSENFNIAAFPEMEQKIEETQSVQVDEIGERREIDDSFMMTDEYHQQYREVELERFLDEYKSEVERIEPETPRCSETTDMFTEQTPAISQTPDMKIKP